MRQKPIITSDIRRDSGQVLVKLYPRKDMAKLPPDEQVQALMAMATVFDDLAAGLREEAAMVVDQVVIA